MQHIDDDPINRALVQEALEDISLLVRSCDNVADGIKEAIADPPDLFLLDVEMPGVSGLEACQSMRQIAALKNIPIVMLTGMDRLKDAEKGLEAGANDYLTKPFDLKRLQATITKWLQKSR